MVLDLCIGKYFWLVKKEKFLTPGRSGFKFLVVLLLMVFFKTTNP
jgi:hypothetical protein